MTYDPTFVFDSSFDHIAYYGHPATNLRHTPLGTRSNNEDLHTQFAQGSTPYNLSEYNSIAPCSHIPFSSDPIEQLSHLQSMEIMEQSLPPVNHFQTNSLVPTSSSVLIPSREQIQSTPSSSFQDSNSFHLMSSPCSTGLRQEGLAPETINAFSSQHTENDFARVSYKRARSEYTRTSSSEGSSPGGPRIIEGVPENFLGSFPARSEESNRISSWSVTDTSADVATLYKLRTRTTRCYWCKEEDDQLLRLVSRADADFDGPFPWTEVAKLMPWRTASMCSKRFRILDRNRRGEKGPKTTRSAWTAADDADLLFNYEKYTRNHCGQVPWTKIGSEMKQPRTGQQACVRYTEALDTKVVHGRWTRSEDAILLEKWQQLGSRWSTISNLIPGRTQRQCASRFMVLLKPSRSMTNDRGKEAIEAEELLRAAKTRAVSCSNT